MLAALQGVERSRLMAPERPGTDLGQGQAEDLREPGRGLQVFLLAPSGERERTLTPEGIEVGQGIPCDGRRIACVAPDGRVSLYPLDGGPVRELGGLEAGTVPLVFSPNGRALLVRGPRATATAPHLIYRVDLATGERTFLRALAPVDADKAAQALMSLAVGIILQGVLDPTGARWDRVIQDTIGMLVEGMGRKPS